MSLVRVMTRKTSGCRAASSYAHVLVGFIAASAWLTLAGGAAAVNFTVEPVPPGAGPGAVAIALDQSGNPHLVYGRGTDFNGDFQHAFKSAGVWHFQQIEDHQASYPAMAFKHDTAYVAYQDPFATTARLATSIAGTWSSQVVDVTFPIEGQYMALALDQSGIPHLSYFEDSGADNLKHNYPVLFPHGEDADGFGSSVLQGRYTSIAASSDDSLFISYGGDGGTTLKVGENTGTGWTTIIPVAGLRLDGITTAISFASRNHPAVACIADYNPGPGFPDGHSDLVLIERAVPSTWQLTDVDTLDVNGNGSAGVGLVYDNFGQPHCLYTKLSGGPTPVSSLWHAYRDNTTGWHREQVDPGPGINQVSLTIDAANVLHAGFHADLGYPRFGEVRYARGTFGSWTIDYIEGGHDDVGSVLDVAVNSTADDRPIAIVYNATHGDIQMHLRSDNFGNWSLDDIATAGDVGRLLALRHIPMNPDTVDCVYYDATNGTIVRATGGYDAWSYSTVASNPSVSSLAYADSAGWGRVAFYDSALGNLDLVRIGPGGTSVVAADQTGNVGRNCQIGVTSDGVTHLLYQDQTNHTLKHARFDSGAWSYDVVAAGAGMGAACAVATRLEAVVTGFYDSVGGDLYSAHWTGSGWTVSPVDTLGDVGDGCAIAVAGPTDLRITYYDRTNKQLKFARVFYSGQVHDLSVVPSDGWGPSVDWGRFSAVAVDQAGLAEIVFYDATSKWPSFALEKPESGAGVDPVATIASPHLTVAPNPARDGVALSLLLSGVRPSVGQVEVTDLQGRRVAECDGVAFGNGRYSLQLPPGHAGLLFVTVRIQGIATFSRKVVVIR